MNWFNHSPEIEKALQVVRADVAAEIAVYDAIDRAKGPERVAREKAMVQALILLYSGPDLLACEGCASSFIAFNTQGDTLTCQECGYIKTDATNYLESRRKMASE